MAFVALRDVKLTKLVEERLREPATVKSPRRSRFPDGVANTPKFSIQVVPFQ